MSTIRENYYAADRMARKQGIKRTMLSRDRHDIMINLYREFGVKIGSSVLCAYRPDRDLATMKYLFALLCFSHRSEDHWRQMQRKYNVPYSGVDHPVALAARKTFEYWDDQYWTECQRVGGLISIDETTRIVRLWQAASDRADWRKQYGDR